MNVNKWVFKWLYDLEYNEHTKKEKQVLFEKIVRSLNKTKVVASRKLVKLEDYIESLPWCLRDSKLYREAGSLQGLIGGCDELIQEAKGLI